MKELEDPRSNQVQLIIKECGLAATSIDQGLTTLRKSHFAVKGLYYQSFFLLSIGIERLLKLIVIIKNLVENNKFPENNELKSYGHKISEMFNSLTEELRPHDLLTDQDVIYCHILEFLSDFAQSSRYYNLDTLSGRKTNTNDPLHEWFKIQQIIKVKHCKSKDFSPYELAIVKSMSENSTFLYSKEDDTPIDDAYSYFEEGKYLDKIQGYSVFYYYQIIDYLVSILLEVASKKRMLPHYHEFFPLFNNQYMTKERILRKKQWDYFTNPR
jgi:hypothetical protein